MGSPLKIGGVPPLAGRGYDDSSYIRSTAILLPISMQVCHPYEGITKVILSDGNKTETCDYPKGLFP